MHPALETGIEARSEYICLATPQLTRAGLLRFTAACLGVASPRPRLVFYSQDPTVTGYPRQSSPTNDPWGQNEAEEAGTPEDLESKRAELRSGK